MARSRLPDVALDGLSASGIPFGDLAKDVVIAGAGGALGGVLSVYLLGMETFKDYSPTAKGAVQLAAGLGVAWAGGRWSAGNKNIENAALGAGIVMGGLGILRIVADMVLPAAPADTNAADETDENGDPTWRARLTKSGFLGLGEYVGSPQSNAERIRREMGYISGKVRGKTRFPVRRSPPSPQEMAETGPQLPHPSTNAGVNAAWVDSGASFQGLGIG